MKLYNEDIKYYMDRINDVVNGKMYAFDWTKNVFVVLDESPDWDTSQVYADLFYIKVNKGEKNRKEYTIASFYRDFDDDSGNIHVLPGAIQIWKGDYSLMKKPSKPQITYIEASNLKEITETIKNSDDISKCKFKENINKRLRYILLEQLGFHEYECIRTSENYSNVVWENIPKGKTRAKDVKGWNSAYEIYVSKDGHIVAKYGKITEIGPVNNTNGKPNRSTKSCISPNDYNLEEKKWILIYDCLGTLVDEIPNDVRFKNVQTTNKKCT